MRIAGARSAGNRVIEVRNPYTNALVGTVPKASVDDIRGAFATARAYRARLTRYERSEILNKASGLIRARAEAISDLITAECGIGKKDSRYEVGRACDVFTFAAQRRAGGRRPDLLVRPDAARQIAQGVHAARAAARRDLRDHAVQPPAEPGRAQGRAVHRDQQPHGAEADGEDAAVRAAAGRHSLRSRTAAGNVLGGHGRSRGKSPTRC